MHRTIFPRISPGNKLAVVGFTFIIVTSCSTIPSDNPRDNSSISTISSQSNNAGTGGETNLPADKESGTGEESSTSSSSDIPSEPDIPTRTPPPIDLSAHPVVPEISQRAIEIFQHGIAMGNDPNRFSKIGDCQNISTYFLAMFEKDSRYYTLGKDYEHLQATIDWYRGSFSRESLAVSGGLNVARVLSPFHADVELCEPNESSLECEVRLYNPSITIVSLEENWGGKTAEDYEGFLRTIIEFLISEGVLPILATKADNYEGDNSINLTIIKLAIEYELPLWNFWLAVQPLPNHGLRDDGFYLTYATPHFDRQENMQASWPWRNLTALQVIDAVRIAVSK